MQPPNDPEIRFALHAVRQASVMVRRVRAATDPEALRKGDRSPVTVADFASQALVGRLIEESFPADPLVAEEDSTALRAPQRAATLQTVCAALRDPYPEAGPEIVCEWIDRGGARPGPRFWVLDPIDGTKGFLRGDQYAVALALVVAGRVELGVLGCPHMDVDLNPDRPGAGALVFARRDHGAWVTPLEGDVQAARALSVSDVRDPARARLVRSFEAAHTDAERMDRLAEALGAEAPPVRMDSQAKYAVLAAGQGELYLRLLSAQRLDYREKIWDQAAGSVILTESGGRVTDLDGRPLDFTRGRTLLGNRGVLASNGHLHARALEAVRAVGA